MKKTLLFAFLFSILAVTVAAQSSEEAAVRVPLENYIKGHETGNGDFMRKAFHTDGNLIFIREGNFTTRSFAEYIAGSSGKPAADEANRKRKIEAIDISGNAAVAKIILDYPATRFVDYMSLLKINGEWKIVAKVFYAEPKAKPGEPKKGQ
ncbi:MAG TPA: nuclear transport factor 2 family protein [Pyrinomonadaceae bacterium]|nr:nuclear transport factor 2 family protein [Pyrinomonadaceae bacterium]